MGRPVSLALLASALALSSCGGGHDASGPSAPRTSIAASGTVLVPWADLPATHPSIPSTRVPARPDPALAAAARRCRADDLVLHGDGNGAAAGTMVENLTFSLARGHTPCAVSGRPRLVARTVEGVTVPGHASTWATYRHRVLLTASSRALVQLVWPSACYARSGRASATLTYAGRAWVVSMGALSATCHFGPPDRPLGSVGITDLVPPVRHRAHRVTAYSHVRVRGPGPVTAHIDRPVSFRVTLTFPRDLALDPCPDFRLGASDGSGGTFGLNCAAVPYRDDRGRPYLPAGRPVSFEMRLDPVDALQKYWWRIVAPGSPPYAAGVVVLR